MNVLSLFDGISCGQLALQRAGIKVTNYFASEKDKYAIQVAKKNFPNTIHLGDVTQLNGYTLPKIDILIGGSPCQSFSFAGKQNGMSTLCNLEVHTLEHYLQLKAQGYQFEGESYLFWEYMRLLHEVKPTYFLLENVPMSKHWQRILSQTIGIAPIQINSALVSAQHRRRLYWTNIGATQAGLFNELACGIPQPIDKNIYLKDILEPTVDAKFFLSKKMISYLDEKSNKPANINGKAPTFTAGAHSGGLHSQMCTIEDTPPIKGLKSVYAKSNSLTASMHKGAGSDGTTLVEVESSNNLILLGGIKANQLVTGMYKDFAQGQRIYSPNGKSVGLSAEGGGLGAKTGLYEVQNKIRRLTPIECERLQTLPDNYTQGVSNTQRYKQCGNGWTVDVIAHIFSFLPKPILPQKRNKKQLHS